MFKEVGGDLIGLVGTVSAALIPVLFARQRADRKSSQETIDQLEQENLALWRRLSTVSPCPSCGFAPAPGPTGMSGMSTIGPYVLPANDAGEVS